MDFFGGVGDGLWWVFEMSVCGWKLDAADTGGGDRSDGPNVSIFGREFFQQFQGALNGTHLGRIKQAANMYGNFEGICPKSGTLFGMVNIHNDPWNIFKKQIGEEK